MGQLPPQYAEPLKAVVSDSNGNRVAGAQVTFSTPASGPTGAFGGTTIVSTDTNGIATAPGLTASSTIGSFNATVTFQSQSANFGLVIASSQPNIDIDGNTAYDALTDGLLLVRYMFGVTGDALTHNAIALEPVPTRTTADSVAKYMNDIRPMLDIDGNEVVDALTDGLLLIRYLFGLRGENLISSAIGPGARRTVAGDIESHIQAMLP